MIVLSQPSTHSLTQVMAKISYSNQVMQLVKQTEMDTVPLDKDKAWGEVKGATHNLKLF